MLDRATGQFIWATPFPLDVPDFHISKIDVETGRTHINWDKVKKKDGDRILVCFHNTRELLVDRLPSRQERALHSP